MDKANVTGNGTSLNCQSETLIARLMIALEKKL